MAAVFVDFDRTLLRKAGSRMLNDALVAEGVLSSRRKLPGDRLLYLVNDTLGENVVSMGLARTLALVMRGWSQQQVVRAGERACEQLETLVAPFAPGILADYRRAGYTLVLATTTPVDMIRPFAAFMGFDDVVATRYEVRDGRYTGRIEGGFVWGIGKLAAVRRWAAAHHQSLSESHACSDSVFDVPLLSSVGWPHAVNPDPSLLALAALRRWPIEWWDRPPGVPSLLGLEPYHLLRPFVRPESFPYARFDIEGVERVPSRGPVIVASNHRSYFDMAALAVVAAQLGRPVRFLAKREMFEVPVVGWVARAIGGIPVDRGSGSRRPLEQAEAALAAGQVVVVLPEGTIPRGQRFFDPELHGKTGTARLAASTGAPVVPVGLWGTEQVWPRSARVPEVSRVRHPPTVRVRVGKPIELGLADAVADTAALMRAISEQLPAEARRPHHPSAEELARTFPPGRDPGPTG